MRYKKRSCFFQLIHVVITFTFAFPLASIWPMESITYALQRFLSCAAVRTSLQDCHPALDLSFSTVRRQFVFGRSFFLFPSGVVMLSCGYAITNCL